MYFYSHNKRIINNLWFAFRKAAFGRDEWWFQTSSQWAARSLIWRGSSLHRRVPSKTIAASMTIWTTIWTKAALKNRSSTFSFLFWCPQAPLLLVGLLLRREVDYWYWLIFFNINLRCNFLFKINFNISLYLIDVHLFVLSLSSRLLAESSPLSSNVAFAAFLKLVLLFGDISAMS